MTTAATADPVPLPAPALLLEKALENPSVSADAIGKLMSIYERWQANQAKEEFNCAFVAARAEMPQLVKDTQGSRSKYIQLETALAQIEPCLRRHHMCITWCSKCLDGPGNWVEVTGILRHAAGHSEQTTVRLSADAIREDSRSRTSGYSMNMSQAMGSAVTYGSRYTLFPLLGIAAANDTDGGAPLRQLAVASPQPQPKQQFVPLGDVKAFKEKLAQQYAGAGFALTAINRQLSGTYGVPLSVPQSQWASLQKALTSPTETQLQRWIAGCHSLTATDLLTPEERQAAAEEPLPIETVAVPTDTTPTEF